jgi:hypothetical protein
VETLPVQIKSEILWQVNTDVTLRSDGVIGVLKFLFVHVNWHISSLEVLQSAGMVEVEMAHDNCLDVFDVMAGLLDLSGEFVVRDVINASEDVVQRSAPDWGILSVWCVR